MLRFPQIIDRFRLVPVTLVLFTGAFLLSDTAWAAKSKFNRVVGVGEAAPRWSDLPGTDGKAHSLEEFKDAKAVVIVFIANRCPTFKVYESRVIEFAKTYGERGVQVVAVSVSRDEADGLEKMKERAKDRGYPFHYLHDPTQKVGRDYGATVTPHVFLLDRNRNIAYMGAFDDHLEEGKVEKMYLIDATEAVLNGKAPLVKESLQRGCEIEYK